MLQIENINMFCDVISRGFQEFKYVYKKMYFNNIKNFVMETAECILCSVRRSIKYLSI